MARRIVSARDQVEMLSPWREAAWDEAEYMNRLRQERFDRQQNATKIYRGLRVDLPPDLEAHIRENYRKDIPYDLDEMGGHLSIGPKLLDHLQSSHPNLLNFGNGYGFDGDDKLGLGRHWTTNREFAEKAAMQGGKGRHSIILEADRPGPEHRDPNHTGVGGFRDDNHKPWEEEEEDTLFPGTPLNITGVKLNGKEVLHDPRLAERMPNNYGVPYPGGTRQHTAGPRRRFNQDWQQVGFDLMPVDVVSHYMQRKETGFGDEKAPLYELSKQPPLSEQIKQRGYEKPVHLVTDGRSGSIYDGHHRIDIARQLGHTHVPVEVSWRNSSGYPEGAYGNKIEPWLKNWLTDMRGGRETVGKIAAANGWGSLSHEDRVSVAENVMERSGFGGKIFHIPTAYLKDAEQLGMFDNLGRPDAHTLQRQHSKEAEDYVNGVLESRGYRFVQSKPYSEVKPLQGDPIKVEPEHWDLRQPGSGQAFTDGYSKIGLAGNHVNQLTLLHEAAHILHGTAHDGRREGHGPNFQQTLHGLYREHLGPEAADIFAGIVFPDHRTAAWYHTSPSRLPVGTELTPGGGRSPYDPYYRAVGEPDRRNHVWVEDDPRLLKRWHDIDADANYHYRVEPDGDPRPYRDGDTSQGYVVPRARIVEDLGPAKRRKGSVDRPPLSVNINDTKQDFTGQILRGEKTIETRDTNSLRPLIGQRIGISRTHRNPRIPTLVVGYATLGEPKVYASADDFDADYHLHRVAPDSDFHFNKAKYGIKYGYPLHDVEPEPDPYPPSGTGYKWRST